MKMTLENQMWSDGVSQFTAAIIAVNTAKAVVEKFFPDATDQEKRVLIKEVLTLEF